jgi:hypothetical protein
MIADFRSVLKQAEFESADGDMRVLCGELKCAEAVVKRSKTKNRLSPHSRIRASTSKVAPLSPSIADHSQLHEHTFSPVQSTSVP